MKKKCEECILNQFDEDEFKCEGDLKYLDCIARLQGTIDILKGDTAKLRSEPNSDMMQVDYELYGHGSVYISKYATEAEIAEAILGDCEEREITFKRCND